MKSIAIQTAAMAALAALCAGCAKPPAPAPVAARPVKVEVASSDAPRSDAAFVGSARAKRRASLSFESSGRVGAILVDIGDRVQAGQVLARLDDTPSLKAVERAQAERDAAASSLADKKQQLAENASLAQDAIISPSALLTVQTQYRVAASQLQAAEAALAIARRGLSLSTIRAPFDGFIVDRGTQPHNDIGAGAPVLQIEGGDEMEIVVMLPDALAAGLADAQASASPPATPGRTADAVPLKLERMSSRRDSGSLVEAVFRVAGKDSGLRSGSLVSVNLRRPGPSGMSVPATALVASTTPGQDFVYVLNPAKGRLERHAVHLDDSLLPQGRRRVTTGLKSGDLVVVAGAAFLSDGQAAIRHMPTTRMMAEVK